MTVLSLVAELYPPKRPGVVELVVCCRECGCNVTRPCVCARDCSLHLTVAECDVKVLAR